jgi:minichromosome maintenance protein 10
MLAAASRSEWNTYTTDGSDKGSTTLATCGIITSDTTSRVSSKTGRAFGMIQLGDIIGGSLPLKSNNIHALVTVFLFGEALSVIQRNKRFLQKGWVCAILSPSLMPSKNDNKGSSSTAVSLSVNDPKQVLLIGRSVDAGNCKGTIRKKVASEYGGSKFEDVGCSTLIDLRGGSKYCITHRRQGLSSRGTSTNDSKTSSDSRLQKLRIDNVRNGITLASSFNNNNHQRNNNLLSQNSMQVGRTSSISLSEALSMPGFLDETLPVAASSSMTATTQHMIKAPKHMKKATNVNETRVLHNPYAKSKATDQCAKRKGHDDVLGEALGRKKVRLDNSISKNASSTKANVKPTKSKVFQAEGYDGSVQVPKPSSLFRKAATFRPGSLSSSANNKTGTFDILEKQRSLAELLQQKKQGVVNSRTEDLLSRLSSNMTRVQPSSSSVKSGQSSRNTFASSFGDFGNDNDILNAKSRFASAANAQEYARARGAIQELEVKEFEMDKRKQRTSGGGATKNGGKDKEASPKGIVTAGWICKTCKKKTPMKPVVCIRAKHDVQQQRELSNRKSTIGSTKERLQRHGKEAEEGGLTLGSGLEWSWRGGIN